MISPYRYHRLTHPDRPRPRFVVHLVRDRAPRALFFSHAADPQEAGELVAFAEREYAHLGAPVLIDEATRERVDLASGERRPYSPSAPAA